MRILITTDCIGGVWDFSVTLVKRLCTSGHEVMVAIPGEPTSAKLACMPAEAVVESRPFRLEWMSDSDADVRLAAAWLQSLSVAWRADVVHLNQMAYTGFVLFPAPTVVVVHSDVFSWFREVRRQNPPAEWNHYGRWVRQGLASASAVVAPSRYQGELTQRCFGRSPDRIIHNGLDPPQETRIGGRARILLTAGRAWDEAKGVAVLADALHALGDAAPEAHHFGSLLSPEGVSGRVSGMTCHGHVEPSLVHQWMRRAHAYVAPSMYEPFGLAPLEAAFHGCALLLSDIPTFRELWDGCAEFFAAGDAGALAGAITRICSDADLSDRLAAKARARAVALFTAERMASSYQALYQQLIIPGDRDVPMARLSAGRA